MAQLTVLQSLACEALWLALQERNVDKTSQGLTRQTPHPEARVKLAAYVVRQPITRLPKLVLPEFGHRSNLRHGFTQSWSTVCAEGLRHDENVRAEGNKRVSQMPPLPNYVSSSESGSKEPSERSDAGSRDDATPKASDKPEGSAFAFKSNQS